MDVPWKRSRSALVACAAILLGAYAGMEALAAWIAEVGLPVGGILVGIALAAAFFALLLVAPYTRAPLPATATAVLVALVELCVGASLVFALAACAAVLLPVSLSRQFMHGTAAADFILYTFLGLAILVTARALLRLNEQSRKASAAALDAAQAQARLAERERALAQSELTLMRAQIEPHFLWNTLAHVQYLAKKHPDDAVTMTGHLIGYLRGALPKMRGESSTVQTEAELVRTYLELMKMRMGERLSVSVDVDPVVGQVPLAPLLLQTLVENAVKHGVEPKVGPVSVRVHAGIDPEDERLVRIEVNDNGVGLQPQAATAGSGMGLKSVRERLRMLYGEHGHLAIVGRPEGGLSARIAIPRKRLPYYEA